MMRLVWVLIDLTGFSKVFDGAMRLVGKISPPRNQPAQTPYSDGQRNMIGLIIL